MEAEHFHDCDVLVAGTGAAGLSAAVTAKVLGLDVLVVEKSARYGGTSARSGGGLWVPGNSINARKGIQDSAEDAMIYLRHEIGNRLDSERVEAYLEAGQDMIDFMQAHTHVRFIQAVVYPDYHPEAPGGKARGRGINTMPTSLRSLGPLALKLEPPIRDMTIGGLQIAGGRDLLHFTNAARSFSSAAYVARRVSRHLWDLLTFGVGSDAASGNALIARLMQTVMALGIPVWLSAPLEEIEPEGGGAWRGLVKPRGGPVRIRARHGVVLACGGFPHDATRRGRLYPHVASGAPHYPMAPASNTGDGLRLAESAGGAIDSTFPNAAAWVPVSLIPQHKAAPRAFPHFLDRGKPGVIAVDATGGRFVNEAASYHDFCQPMIEGLRKAPDTAFFLICDHATLRRYGLGAVRPFPSAYRRHLGSGYLVRAASVAELARRLDIDPDIMTKVIDAFNLHADKGVDPEFGRGASAYDRLYADPDHRPNPTLGRIARAPYYALRIHLGDIGTFVGIKTDGAARVLDSVGAPIPGLFAVGNDMSSVMAGTYPGAGITLGPAMTFGYLAAKTIHAMSELSSQGARAQSG